MTARKPQPTGSPHLFVPDPEVPPDHRGRGACAECHVMGEAGDAHHRLPDTREEQALARHRVDPHDE